MRNDPPYDARAVANLMLDEAKARGRSLTNLSLQKLLYFAHARFLIEKKQPLIAGYFEAWRFGPVHPLAYQVFKEANDQEITFRATKSDIMTGEKAEIVPPNSTWLHDFILEILVVFGKMSPGRLVDISHAPNAPWDFVVNKGETSLAFGMRIPDNVIIERFKFHKIAVTADPLAGEPREDSPFV